jgi:hypothetical protein
LILSRPRPAHSRLRMRRQARPRTHAPLPSARHETTETMTLSRGFRGDAGCFRRTAAHVVAAALVVTAMCAALWAGPAASASAARAQSPAAASASAKRVKYYIVPRPGKGPAVALYGIAARTLGDTHRYIEIFNLNKGRLQPDGRRLENPNTIDPGWILQLPADASGPGVHFGRLPAVTPSATSPASHRPSRPAAGGTAAPHSSLGSTGTGSVIVVGGALVLLAIAGLVVGLSRRRAGAAARRKHSHTRGPEPQGDVRTGGIATTAPDIRATDPRWPAADPRFPAAGPRRPAADHPSFPGADPRWPAPHQPAAGPRRPAADHPSFPGADHPSFPGADPRWPGPDPGWPRAVGRSSGPRGGSPPEPHYDQRSRAASPPAAAGVRNPPGNWGPPAGGPDGTQRWPAPVARTAGTAIQPYRDVAFGDSPLQVVLTDAPAVGWERATGLGARAEDMLHLSGGQAAQLAHPVRRAAGGLGDVQSLWLAGRILSGAENQAAEIRYEARDQAAATRAVAEREAAEIRQQAAAARAVAEQEAAEIRQQAAAARAIAEQEAAEIRAAALTMSDELGRVAAYVTESLTSPSMPATKPADRPTTKPDGRQVTKPDARPDTSPDARPITKPAARPATRPADRPGTKPGGRQVKTMRKMVVALVAVFLVGAVSGTTEIALHGFSFFIFRNAGAGAGNSRNLDENQGPGQRDAPGAHHKANTSKPSSRPSSKPSKSN